MKKQLLFNILSLLMVASLASPVLAAKAKCKVVSIKGTTLVIDCGKKARKLQPGTSVTMTGKKKEGGGC